LGSQPQAEARPTEKKDIGGETKRTKRRSWQGQGRGSGAHHSKAYKKSAVIGHAWRGGKKLDYKTGPGEKKKHEGTDRGKPGHRRAGRNRLTNLKAG